MWATALGPPNVSKALWKVHSTASSTGLSKRNGRKGTAANPSYKTCQPQSGSRKGSTYTDRSIRPDGCVLCIFQCSSRVPHNAVYCESGQAHTGKALEDRPLYHNTSEVLNGRHMTNFWSNVLCRQGLPPIGCPHGHHSWLTGVFNALVPQIGFVAFMPNVANQVCPGNTIRRSDKPWMSYRAKGLSDV